MNHFSKEFMVDDILYNCTFADMFLTDLFWLLNWLSLGCILKTATTWKLCRFGSGNQCSSLLKLSKNKTHLFYYLAIYYLLSCFAYFIFKKKNPKSNVVTWVQRANILPSVLFLGNNVTSHGSQICRCGARKRLWECMKNITVMNFQRTHMITLDVAAKVHLLSDPLSCSEKNLHGLNTELLQLQNVWRIRQSISF